MIQNHLSPLLSLFTQVAQFQVSTGGSVSSEHRWLTFDEQGGSLFG